ncbi:hypothetical protein LPB67_16185 [Undibacterium sp. Jales W-56]|uniref:hypothetical protein n=1 Tax=Undibacterium sp. Jales W-56 TaxID=2897325 RepID=UPI0021D2310D|nr:hypothetical protein [Undibacterium sp. Jales W-56]MCU6435316.1 hypothetical protein [Undibacterium sp. Jales W-56]
MQNSFSAPSAGRLPDPAAGRSPPVAGQSVLSMMIDPVDEDTTPFNDAPTGEWDEEDIVFLHWRLLKEVGGLRDPATPLEEKLDTLRWIFTEREKESRPFSFVNCLNVVGCSPLSPLPYFGRLDADEIRDAIQCQVKFWLNATLMRYPSWVREAVLRNPTWIESRLSKNPQWINEQVKKHSVQGDLFA